MNALHKMEPEMENEYDRPQIVSENGQVIEGRNNATYQRDEGERRRLEAEKNKHPDLCWRKPVQVGDEGFSPNIAKALSSNETDMQLTHHTDHTQWHAPAPHFAKCPGNIFCDKRFRNPDDQVALLHEYPEARTFKLTKKTDEEEPMLRDVDAISSEDVPESDSVPEPEVTADGGDDTDDAPARR
jgi:hypothetical protein